MIPEQSNLVSKTLGLVLPLVLIVGIYIILNGHVSPGGGFQGGALLASVFICKYLMVPMKDVSLSRFQVVEKILLLALLLFALTFMSFHLYRISVLTTKVYLILMNALIGLKVACGMSIIFYRFAFYESR